MKASFLQELGIFDCVVLQQNSSGTFTLLHANNHWFNQLFPSTNTGETISLDLDPVYLVDFLFDANEFWELGSEGRINSGIWSESIGDDLLRLEAAAILKDNERFLVLFNLENEYNKRQSTLQIARELLLSNDRIIEQHEQILERIEAATREISSEDIKLSAKGLIDSAEFGVAIFDSNIRPLEQNPSLYRIFETREGATRQPAEVLLELCQRQFPEFERVLETSSRWSGELYWLKPPALSRWLQLTVCPVKDSRGVNSHWLFMVTDISREKYLQQSNEKLTYFDVLTNLPNRQYFWQSLENAIDLNQSFFVLQLDVKHLKRTNEIFGFTVGDLVLKEIVERIRPFLNQNDIFARIGGNEFAVILRDCEQSHCEKLAKQLIETVSEPYFVQDKYKCNVGLSIGAAHYPCDSLNAEELMKYADLSSFSAKQKPKSNIQFYSTELKERSRKRIELEAAIREAIEQEQFELYLQPVLDLEKGCIVKAEALIRWQKPGTGIVPPDEFIPLAEQTGLIVSIGKWVIDRAMKILADLHKQDKPIKISVNLSPVQVNDRNLLDFIHYSVTDNDIDASYLELELTEGVLVQDFEKISYFLEEVRKLGISVAIDDFGTGYSSLSYLQKLPIDHLKIDRSFVCELTGNESDKAIVLAVIAMAKSLNLGVIAEGVEKEEQQQFLKDNSCQAAQGYLYSRPIPYDEFCKLLDE
ncbi:putative bifunctional diguanylate cyclase/phosphodiesterase [Vibrio sp. HN007]|uniref:putative bifunctional diguanylate cyclase/phosphodiesterase n=1 Tax=Vibrio iocasae TaxID=3098914 RepID=UPI0035D4C0EE